MLVLIHFLCATVKKAVYNGNNDLHRDLGRGLYMWNILARVKTLRNGT